MKQMRVTTTLRVPFHEPKTTPWGPWTDNKAEVIATIADLVARANTDNAIPEAWRPETLDIKVVFRDSATLGTCDSHVGTHTFSNDPNPCIGWKNV